jgi:hypothetical protein
MRGCNADDCEGHLYDYKVLSQRGRIAGEHSSPESITDDGNRMNAAPAVFVECKRPPDHGMDAQQGKEVDGGQSALDGARSWNLNLPDVRSASRNSLKLRYL